jgi:hypothetical protein
MLVPVWGVALFAAAVAPWCVRAVAGRIERRSRLRTNEVVTRAQTLGSGEVPHEGRRTAATPEE